MRGRIEFGLALLLEVIGAGGALLVATRSWQTVTTVRPRPFGPDVLGLTGRTIDSAPTALALVALAGVVAVLATKRAVRRVIGGLVAAAGAVLVVRSAMALPAIGAARARDLVAGKHPRAAGVPTAAHSVATHPVWGALSICCGVLVVVAGLLIALRGAHWAAMSAKYEPPRIADDHDEERVRARADAALWGALERGEDPTDDDPRAPH